MTEVAIGRARMAVPSDASRARCDVDGLNRLLSECHRWEAEDDPDGRLLPRAKRHDDKALVVVKW